MNTPKRRLAVKIESNYQFLPRPVLPFHRAAGLSTSDMRVVIMYESLLRSAPNANWAVRRKAIQSLRLVLHSCLRQSSGACRRVFFVGLKPHANPERQRQRQRQKQRQRQRQKQKQRQKQRQKAKAQQRVLFLAGRWLLEKMRWRLVGRCGSMAPAPLLGEDFREGRSRSGVRSGCLCRGFGSRCRRWRGGGRGSRGTRLGGVSGRTGGLLRSRR